MERADGPAARTAVAQAHLRSDEYVGARLRVEPATRTALEALPELIALARRQDGAALIGALRALSDRLTAPPREPARGAGSGPLWDALIAHALTRRQPAQDPADVVDLLRVLAAIDRARATPGEQAPSDGAGEQPDARVTAAAARHAEIAAALTATPVLPPWAVVVEPGSPAARGIRPAGVADLLVVEDELVGYTHAELSYVENVLRTETKQRTYRRLDRSVDSYSLTTTEEEETERDLQTTQRSELQSQIDETVTTDASLTSGVAVSAAYGPFVSVDANVSATLGTSTETSSSVSQSYVQDVVDRSVTKVSASVRERTAQRVLAETEETTLHGFTNTTEADVVGHYRWLEQVWRAQIKNYGRRLMIELPAPEPAALWRAARDTATADAIQLAPPYPIGSLSPADLSESTWNLWVGRYGVSGITPPPAEEVHVNRTFELPELEHQEKLKNDDFVVRTKVDFIEVPAGYEAVHVWADESKKPFEDVETQLRAHIGEQIVDLVNGPREDRMNPFTGRVEVALFLYNFKAATVDVRLRCTRTDEAYATWQVQTFEKIHEAWRRSNDAYLAEVTRRDAEATVAATQLPATVKRQIERDELQRCALTVLLGDGLAGFDAVSGPTTADPHPVIDPAEALDEHAVVLFHQLAFEWEQLTYSFYPYFWGRKDGWFAALRESDPDLTFQAFLRAGAARVQLPVRPGYERAVLHYLWTGDVWSGGDAPVVGDHLYVPIVEEIAEGLGLSLTSAEPYGDPWTYTLPTTLVVLDPDVSDLGL